MKLTVMGRMGRVGAAMLVIAVSVLGIGAVTAPQAQAADVGMSKPVYGANEAVMVAVGMTDYVRNCAQVPGADIPVNDWLYGVSDLYVVPSSSTPSGTLTDVSGSPNVVFGQIGGAFVDEVIGYTAPGGSIPPGRYGIVIDNCQDSHFDPAVDTFIPDAFRVTSDVNVPPLNITALKADATRKAGDWEAIQYSFTGMVFAANAWELYGAMTDPADMLIFMVTDAFVKSAGLPDAKAEAMNLAKSTARHYGGIAADPPNYAYDEPVSPGEVPELESDDADPVMRALVSLGEQSGIEGSLAEAFLESVEKYQGAARDRNGVWARQHARAAQRYARALAAQLPASSAAANQVALALRADTTGVDTVLSTIGNMLIDARTNGIGADVRANAAALGMSDDDLQQGLRTIDNLGLAGISKAGIAATLDDLVASSASMSANLAQIADDLDGIIAQLDGDPLMTSDSVTAHAGGPYSGATGASVALDASASTGSGTLSYAWDLDGDGAFGDATGATPSFTVATGTPGLVSVKVTGIDGIADIATAPFTNTAGGVGPAIISRTPIDGIVEIESGDTLNLVVAPTPGTTTTWWVDATETHTGDTFELVTGSSDVGSRQVTATVTDAAGKKTSATWWVKISGVDADGDGWPVPLDCNDGDDTINPGMPDVANGIDDDCDPSTSDGTPEPVVTLDLAPDPVGSADPPPPGADGLEGVAMQTSGTIDTSGSGTVTRRIDWGDGSPTETDSVSRSQFASRLLEHTYVDDGTYSVQLCGRYATSPWGCTYQNVTIVNQSPKVNFTDLSTWQTVNYPHGGFANQGPADWQVSDGHDSVLQVRNSDPSVFLSPDSYIDVEATVELGVETSGDDDFIGFVLGGAPDMFENDDAQYLLIDWKQGNQSGAFRGLAVSSVTGVLDGNEMWRHTDNPATTGVITELTRATNLCNTGWADNTSYALTFRFTPDRLQIWVDGTLEIDLAGDFGTDARFGFYNYSQDDVRYRNFAQTSVAVDEGTLVPFSGYFADPGVVDTHSGLFDWGDGSPADRVEVISTVDGFGQVAASHPYLDDGSYDSSLCVTDNAGDTGCQHRQVEVRNVAPVVDAGRDRVGGPDVILEDSVFSDIGVADTHTATVDWGDGSPVEAATVSGDAGSGVVGAAHRYSVDGPVTVQVCVTDDDGGTGCDSFEATLSTTNGALTATGEDDATADEGDLVTRQVAFDDVNPTDTHTATIDWGDGTTESMDVADGGAIGVGTATHRYADDADYQVVARVCDDRGVCEVANSKVTVANLAPDFTVDAPGTVEAGQVWSLTGDWTDAGTDDTHSVIFDWGDGTTSQLDPEVSGPGKGIFAASHRFIEEGEPTVKICVVDDDEGSSCTTLGVQVTAAPPETTTTATPGTTTNPPGTTSAPGTTVPESVTPTTQIVPTAEPVDGAEVETTPTVSTEGELPRTGSPLSPMVTLAVLGMIAGVLLIVVSRRRARRMAD